MVGATAALPVGIWIERRRQAHAERMLLRSERRIATARLLAAADAYHFAAGHYKPGAESPSAVEAPRRELELAFLEATMLANDGSKLMRGLYATYAATRMAVGDQNVSESPATEDELRLHDAKEQLINAMRDELGVAHWLSPGMRKALGSKDD